MWNQEIILPRSTNFQTINIFEESCLFNKFSIQCVVDVFHSWTLNRARETFLGGILHRTRASFTEHFLRLLRTSFLCQHSFLIKNFLPLYFLSIFFSAPNSRLGNTTYFIFLLKRNRFSTCFYAFFCWSLFRDKKYVKNENRKAAKTDNEAHINEVNSRES